MNIQLLGINEISIRLSNTKSPPFNIILATSISSLPITPDLHAARLHATALPGAAACKCVIQLHAGYYDCKRPWCRCERT